MTALDLSKEAIDEGRLRTGPARPTEERGDRRVEKVKRLLSDRNEEVSPRGREADGKDMHAKC